MGLLLLDISKAIVKFVYEDPMNAFVLFEVLLIISVVEFYILYKVYKLLTRSKEES